jgi:hypothetical protein
LARSEYILVPLPAARTKAATSFMVPLLLYPLGKSNEAFGKVPNRFPLSKKQFAFDYGSRCREWTEIYFTP